MKIISSSKIKIILKKTLKTVSPRKTLRDAHLLIREEFRVISDFNLTREIEI